MQRTYLIDTNIFLEVLLAQPKKEDCKRLLSMIRDGKIKGVTTVFTIHSIMILMDKLRKHIYLKTFLSSLTAYKGLRIYVTLISDEIKSVIEVMKSELDIDDAIQYVAALSIGAEAIISYDKHFDRLPLPRKEPAEIIKEHS